MYITLVIAYISLLFAVSWLTSRSSKGGENNKDFFSAGHNVSWLAVAFGMIGASISGISVVSVPGMVAAGNWSYLQTCLGFVVGYAVVAYLLLPIYYRMEVVSIYQILQKRFGDKSHITGASLFVAAKLVSSATKLYVAAIVLQHFIFDSLGVPFYATVATSILVIWLYTRQSGMKTIIWTDNLQTLLFLIAITIISVKSLSLLQSATGMTVSDIVRDPMSKIFFWDNLSLKNNFFKQFISGIFIVVVMTGLDQDMMQKNLTCRTLRESRRNMLSYGAAFVPINAILLFIGTCMTLYSQSTGLALPQAPDAMVPFVITNAMPPIVGIVFIIGIIAASFSSADSALAAITTTISVDILRKEQSVSYRRWMHALVCFAFALLVIAFGYTKNKSIIDLIYTIVGYTYGPLLGLFSFAIFTKRRPRESAVPIIAVSSPALCYMANTLSERFAGYQFGYELLLLNGGITFACLWVSSLKLKLKQI